MEACNYCKYEDIPANDEPCNQCVLGEGMKHMFENAIIKPGDAIKPDYYNDTKIAPIDVIEDWDLDFCLGSALKYIKRAGKKEGNPSAQDLKKVIWYVERRIKELEEASK